MNIGPYTAETYNDIDSELVNFFQTLRNQGPKLIKAIGLTPFSREKLARACEPTSGLTRSSGPAGFTSGTARREPAWHRPAAKGAGPIVC